MSIIRKRKVKWGSLYGPTHKGYIIYILGVPVFRRRKPL